MLRNNIEPTQPPQSVGGASPTGEARVWLEGLSDDDLMFLRRFVLASGSLKAVARSYEISYPTIRLRLDRLIQKIEVVEAHRDASPFERRLRLLYAEGRIDLESVKELLEEHRGALQGAETPAAPRRRHRIPSGTRDKGDAP